jgi:hypothetical protein
MGRKSRGKLFGKKGRAIFKQARGFVSGIIFTVLVISLAVTGFASTGTKTIQASYNNIKLYVDGNLITPKDASGNAVEPFISGGTTYLPVRAIGEALGKTVDWDGATQSVYVGKRPGGEIYLVEAMKPYELEAAYEEFSGGKTMQIGGEIFHNGFTLAGAYGERSVYFNLNNQYSLLSGVIGPIGGAEGSTVNIFADGRLFWTLDITAGQLPEYFLLDVSGVKQLKFEHHRISMYETMGFAELKLSH